MPVVQNQRTLPLSLASGHPLSASLLLDFDMTGFDTSLAEGAAAVFQGATRPVLTKSGTHVLESQVADWPGRRATASGTYTHAPSSNTGLQVGTGDFTMILCWALPASAPTVGNVAVTMNLYNASSGLSLAMTASSYNSGGTTGWYMTYSGFSGGSHVNSGVAAVVQHGAPFFTIIRRRSGMISAHQYRLGDSAILRRYTETANSLNLDAAGAKTWQINYASTFTTTLPSLVSARMYGTGIDDAALLSLLKNWWGQYTNTAPVDAITLTTPAANSTVSVSTTIGGGFTGTTPSGVQVQLGSGSWITGTGFSASNGTWQASVTLPVGAAQPMRVRETNDNTVVSADVAGITVVDKSITFTTSGDPMLDAVNYRGYQRNLFFGNGIAIGAAQAKIKFNFTGDGSAGFEWSWDGSTWQTVNGTVSGSTVTATITLPQPGQGALTVRFIADPGTSASLTSVVVGDGWYAAGQSNDVGMSVAYVPFSPPAGHEQWVAVKYSKAHVWEPNLETAQKPFDDRTGAVYSVQTDGGTPLGSYFGKMASLVAETGIPVFFVPCALGSTSVAAWAPPNPINSTTSLYGAMVSVADSIGPLRGVIYYQGEANTNADPAGAMTTGLNNQIDSWVARFPGTKWVLVNICPTGCGPYVNQVRAEIAGVAATNPNVLAMADMGSPTAAFTSSVHYGSSQEVTNVATRVFNAIYGGASGIPPVISGPGNATGSTSSISVAEGTTTVFQFAATQSATFNLTDGTTTGSTVGGFNITTGGLLTFTSAPDYEAGSNSRAITVRATANGITVTQTLTVTITNVAPVWTGPAIGAQTFTAGQAIAPIDIPSRFADPAGGTVTGSIVESVGNGLSVVNGQLVGTPIAAATAVAYTPRGTDPAGTGTNGTPFTVTVQAQVNPPTFDGTNAYTVAEGTTTVATLTLSEPCTVALTGADAVRFSFPSGTLSSGALAFAAAPNFESPIDADANNVYAITVTATSVATGLSAVRAINVTVSNVAPAFTGPAIGAQTFTVGQAITPINIASKFTDVGGGTVAGSIVESVGNGLSVVNGQLVGTPLAAAAAVTYTPRGTDAANASTNGPTFTVTVNPAPTYSAVLAEVTTDATGSQILLNAPTRVLAWPKSQGIENFNAPGLRLTATTDATTGRISVTTFPTPGDWVWVGMTPAEGVVLPTNLRGGVVTAA